MIKHATEIPATEAIKDGDHDAVVFRIRDTGSSIIPPTDRYKHTIYHGLGREPVGCQVILSDKICNVMVVSRDINQITVKFDVENADVNIRIW